MATTKLWAVKGDLRSLVDYVENSEKTMLASDDGMRDLFNVCYVSDNLVNHGEEAF